MDNEGRNLADAQQTDGSEQPTGVPDAQVASRKRALLAGLASAPAMLTLLNRSAFAQSTTGSVAGESLEAAGTQQVDAFTTTESTGDTSTGDTSSNKKIKKKKPQ